MSEQKYGVINEIGDLGLGFTELNKNEQKVIKESEQKSSTDNKNKR